MKPHPPNETDINPIADASRSPVGSIRVVEPLHGSALRVSAAPIAGDMLYGADAIATFLFGDRKHRRRVYNLVDGNGLPVFRIGVNICARKSVLLDWIAAQERGNGPDA
jgi:hypothetical protein